MYSCLLSFMLCEVAETSFLLLDVGIYSRRRAESLLFHAHLLSCQPCSDAEIMSRETAELAPGKSTAMLQPLPRPPQRHSQRLAIPATAQPPVLLVANVASASGLAAVLGQLKGRGGFKPDLYINLTLRSGGDVGSVTAAADSWGVSSLSRLLYMDMPCFHDTSVGIGHILSKVWHVHVSGQARTRAVTVSASTAKRTDESGQPPEVERAEEAAEPSTESGSEQAQETAVPAAAEEEVRWDERLILELPPDADKEEVRAHCFGQISIYTQEWRRLFPSDLILQEWQDMRSTPARAHPGDCGCGALGCCWF